MGSQADLAGERFLCCFWADFAVSEAVSEIYCIPKCLIYVLFCRASCSFSALPPFAASRGSAITIGTVWGFLHCKRRGFHCFILQNISHPGRSCRQETLCCARAELILCRGPGKPCLAPAAPRDPVPLCRSLLAPKEGEKPLHSFLLI